MSVVDMVEFLVAQLDEDAAMAHAAALFYDDADQDGVSWEGHAGTDLNGYTRFWIAPHLGTVNDVASGLHINRHDPARVLREVAAKRAILQSYARAVAENDELGLRYIHDDTGILVTSAIAAANVMRALEEVLKALALAYSDRPGYQERWKQ